MSIESFTWEVVTDGIEHLNADILVRDKISYEHEFCFAVHDDHIRLDVYSAETIRDEPTISFKLPIHTTRKNHERR